MTKPTEKFTQAEYLAWIDLSVEQINEEITAFDIVADWRVLEAFANAKASLLANRAVLVRHDDAVLVRHDDAVLVRHDDTAKNWYGKPACSTCLDYPNGFDATPVTFPCPSRNDITNQLDKVMGVEG